MRKISNTLLFVWSLFSMAQDLAIGEWQSHQSFEQAYHLERARNTLFCATANGLFSVDLNTQALHRLTKEDGLGDVAVSALHFAPEAKVLIIGYESGIIDLIDEEGSISTLTTLAEVQILANKKINFVTSNGMEAYLATEFGVVLLDLSNQVVKENYRSIGPGGSDIMVKEMEVVRDSLFIVSDAGIQSGNLSDNLLDFNSWTHFEATSGFRFLANWQNQPYSIGADNHLWKFTGSSWTQTPVFFSADVVGLKSYTQLLAILDDKVLEILPDETSLVEHEQFSSIKDVIPNNNEYWVADATSGLSLFNGTPQKIRPNGPLNDYPTKIRTLNDNVFVFFGPDPRGYDGVPDGIGYSVLKDRTWTNQSIPNFFNITDGVSLQGNLFLCSIGFGLYNVETGTIINSDNSEFIDGSNGALWLTSAEVYNDQIWLSAYNNSQSLFSYHPNGTITSYERLSVGSTYPLSLQITQNGLVWIRRGAFDGNGIAIFEPSTGTSRILRTSDGLPSSVVTGIDISLADDAWISTISGPATFSGASFPFIDFGVNLPIFENGFLLEGEKINDVMTDGGERIWFATDRGVWVFSRNLEALEHHFTNENSPLLSNVVRNLAYQPSTGAVFMNTDKGLIAYRSGSSSIASVSEAIKVFPNPVPPHFSGDVGISGVTRNATIKITDVQGRLIREVSANGNTAKWDLLTFQGNRVKTGVYLLFSSNTDGSETQVGKIAVIE